MNFYQRLFIRVLRPSFHREKFELSQHPYFDSKGAYHAGYPLCEYYILGPLVYKVAGLHVPASVFELFFNGRWQSQEDRNRESIEQAIAIATRDIADKAAGIQAFE